ncbi:MAG: amidohydrolase family protein [Bacteriovorax sp.]|nr:amidohydrolase family protein [Bacteriovorax sp.]
MSTQKIIQANCATSTFTKRLDITFDESTGLITRVEDAVKGQDSVDYFYGDDCLLFAGMGDIHIHAREDVSQKNIYKEDFKTTCCAAINGGVVHVADMPNNPIPPVDDESYLNKFRLTEKMDLPILLYAGIGPSTRPLTFSVPYKVYMGPSIGELFFKDNESLDEVLVHYKNEWVSFHCEDPVILEQNKSRSTHETRRPVSAEIMATDIALKLIKKYNLKGKLCHYSAGEGLKAIISAKKEGVNVTCEVTPQHLYYSIEKLEKKSTREQIFFQMNPPIRHESDRLALINAVKAGDIDYLATDHAPHSQEEKEKGMSGLPGLDTYGAFVTWLILDQNIDTKSVAKIVSEGPGLFFNQFLQELNLKSPLFKKWGSGFGFLQVGFSASFSILNLRSPIKIELSNLKTKAAWSPFLGETFPGRVDSVFLGGKKM